MGDACCAFLALGFVAIDLLGGALGLVDRVGLAPGRKSRASPGSWCGSQRVLSVFRSRSHWVFSLVSYNR